MNKIENYYKKYPLQSFVTNGSIFNYRYYKHPTSHVTLVLLTGGIGLSDLFFLHFEEFAKDFSVITFDYAIDFPNNKSLSDAAAELLKSLGVKAYLVGQSLGGIVAQIIAKRHPEVVEGLILSNTASLAAKMDEVGEKSLKEMVARQKKEKKLLHFLPFSLFKKCIKSAVMKKTSSLSEEEIQLMDDLCNIMLKKLTKEYEYHMIDMLVDLENYQEMVPADFVQFENKVLLILSEDDKTFHPSVKSSLIELMPNPVVVTNITGGHLALLLRIDEYVKEVRGFILSR